MALNIDWDKEEPKAREGFAQEARKGEMLAGDALQALRGWDAAIDWVKRTALLAMLGDREVDSEYGELAESLPEEGRFILARTVRHNVLYWTDDRKWDSRRSAAKVFTKRSVAGQQKRHAAQSTKAKLRQIVIKEVV